LKNNAHTKPHRNPLFNTLIHRPPRNKGAAQKNPHEIKDLHALLNAKACAKVVQKEALARGYASES
jgi:hypothetical protein